MAQHTKKGLARDRATHNSRHDTSEMDIHEYTVDIGRGLEPGCGERGGYKDSDPVDHIYSTNPILIETTKSRKIEISKNK